VPGGWGILTMLDKLKTFFENTFAIPDHAEDEQRQLQVATAALLIDMMLQDDDEHDNERQAILQALQEKFALSPAETDELYRLAEQERKQATDYHQFTRVIANNFSQPQKIQIIEYLWSVAYADGSLDKYEEHMVRRIADLIHVSHKDFLQAKLKFATD